MQKILKMHKICYGQSFLTNKNMNQIY